MLREPVTKARAVQRLRQSTLRTLLPVDRTPYDVATVDPLTETAANTYPQLQAKHKGRSKDGWQRSTS
jgi:hypothetical protein